MLRGRARTGLVWLGGAGFGRPASCRAALWTEPSLNPLPPTVSRTLKLEAGRGGGIVFLLSPERAFTTNIGDEARGSVPEFMPGFRTEVLAEGPPAADGAGAGVGAADGVVGTAPVAEGLGPPGLAGGIEEEPAPGANGDGPAGGVGGAAGLDEAPVTSFCGIPLRPPVPGGA